MIASFARRYGFERLVAIGALEVAFGRDLLHEPRTALWFAVPAVAVWLLAAALSFVDAALHGGRLTAGPTSGGGFAVRVTLPTPDGAL